MTEPVDVAIPILPCHSVAATVAFYRRLGFEGVHRASAAAELTRVGIPRRDALQDKPWGLREFAVGDPDGFTVGWNCGATGGQEVCHAHVHVLPLLRAEPFEGRGIRCWLKSDANRW